MEVTAAHVDDAKYIVERQRSRRSRHPRWVFLSRLIQYISLVILGIGDPIQTRIGGLCCASLDSLQE